MDRRRFMAVSIKSLAFLSLTPLGCGSGGGGGGAAAAAAWSTEVGEMDRFWDRAGNAYQIMSDDHKIAALNEDGSIKWEIGGLGEEAGQLNWPMGMEQGADGHLYVLDMGNHEIDVYDINGNHLHTIGDDEGTEPTFLFCRDMAVDDLGNHYTVDSHNHHIDVHSPAGDPIMTIGEFGTGDGQLNLPVALAFDPEGALHVVDAGNARIVVYDPSGEYQRTYGGYGTDPGYLERPRDIVIDDRGLSYVADAVGGFIQIYDKHGNSTGSFVPTFTDGRQGVPRRLFLKPDGSLYAHCTPGYSA